LPSVTTPTGSPLPRNQSLSDGTASPYPQRDLPDRRRHGAVADHRGGLCLVVLEATEVARRAVEPLGARDARRGRAALADAEILVAEIGKEGGAHLRFVGIDVVDAHVVEGVVDGRPLGGIPETHGLG